MKKFGKKYQATLEILGDIATPRSLSEALGAIEKTSLESFDPTVEIHIRTGCNPKYADQIVRSTVVLPHGTGKTVRVAVFAESEAQVNAAKAAGADVAGGDDLIAEVLKGNINFDVALSTTVFMKNLAKAARVLGPKGLMPSPKAGTVTDDIAKAVDELKKGKIEFRTDKNGIIHSVCGKKSFGLAKLEENARTLIKAISDAKPSGVKGTYLQTISVSSTMGPGVNVEVANAVKN